MFNAKQPNSVQSSTSQHASGFNIPQRNAASIPSSFPRKPRTSSPATAPAIVTASPSGNVQQIPVTATQSKVLVWQKPSLSESDAQRRPTSTSPTANLKLTQANFKANNILIDQKTYFRNQIFNNLSWGHPRSNDNTYEEVFCPFEITILGNSIGTHNLKLSHKPSRAANQGNVPTWLHWGNTVKPFLQQFDVRGKTFNLYTDGQNFFIEIV